MEEGKKTPGELNNEGTYRGYRHGCYGCMPMRNQSHHHSERHYRGNERKTERQRWRELEMEPHFFFFFLQQPMIAAQRKK